MLHRAVRNSAGPIPPFFLAVVLFLACGRPSEGQWLTQSILVKPGWSAVYLHGDASYQSLDQLVGYDPANPISQIWCWKAPVSTRQYLDSPQSPLNGDTQWATWYRPSLGQSSTFGVLLPNAAYLVYSTASTNYTWRIKGKPTPPSYTWDISGLNLIGFPTPAVSPPPFDAYLAPAASLAGSAVEVYQYTGGTLGATNPARVLALHVTPVTRGQAFWMRASNINSTVVVNNTYFGPLQLELPNTTGVDFGDASSQFNIRLRNTTLSNLTVTLRLLASETPPSGQPFLAGTPPLLVRGALNPSNLTYASSALAVGQSQTWLLRPQGQSGSDIALVLGINRYALTNSPGALYAGILQFTESLGFSEVNVPVSAQVASTAGLWVGSARVAQVGGYLKSYQISSNGAPALDANGADVVTGLNTNLGAVPSAYPLRLIIHNDGANSVLLQRVYYGLRQETNLVVATSESVLDLAHLDTARRITATHLPWSAGNPGWPLTGPLALGGRLSTTPPIAVGYDDQAVNPFLHTYHPDHDNLDATFKTQLPQGAESYQITRQISLSITLPGDDFTSLTTANRVLAGNYEETITLGGAAGAARNFNVTGSFTLTRLSPIATLTRP